MSKRDDFKLDVISSLDEEIVDKATKKRIGLLVAMKKAAARTRAIAIIAACLALVIIASVIMIPQFVGGEPEPTEPAPTEPFITEPAPTEPVVPIEKQIPVYEGMTVSNTAPSTETLSLTRLSSKRVIDQKNPFGKGEGHRHIEDEIKDTFIYAEGAPAEYFARKNQDIYIIIHVSNPDNFEIQSFTLNGKKYANYMFETGSDMETLILKYNVGDVEGVQEYTLDAIKYIDGEEIKDVKMEGDRTVRVNITPEDQPTVAVSNVTTDFTGITLTATLSDPESLVSASDGKLYIVLYDGDKLIVNQEITSGTPVTLSDLTPDTVYQYAIIGEYDSIEGQGYAAHILEKKAFATESAVNIELEIDGWDVLINAEWHESLATSSFTSLAVYSGETKLCDLSPSAERIEALESGDTVHIVATYKIGEKSYTYTSEKITAAAQTEGLEIENDTVVGLGDAANEEVLYINMPIDGFLQSQSLSKLYLGKGVTDIRGQAFGRCENLETVSFEKGFHCERLGGIFSDCNKLKSINIPAGVKELGTTFSYCTSLEQVTFEEGSQCEYILRAFWGCSSLTKVELPDGLEYIDDYAFEGCVNLSQVEIPDSVISVSGLAFKNTKYYNDQTNWEDGALYMDGWLIETDGITGSYEIKSGTKGIASEVFNESPNIEGVTIPSSVNNISYRAFSELNKLKTVTFAQNSQCHSIGPYAFGWCSALESINIPDSVLTVDGSAFFESAYYNNGANWDSGTKEVGPLYIDNCLIVASNQTGTYTVKDGTRIIAMYALAYNKKITAIVIPNSVEGINSKAFKDCEKLSSVTFNGTKAQWDAIVKADGWCDGTAFDVIHCIDGDVSIS